MSLRQSTQRYFGYEQLDPRLKAGLVAHWIGNGSGGTMFDWSGYRNHGTLLNGAGWSVGRQEYAANFDGSNDSIDTPNTAAGDRLSALGSALTLSCWVLSTAQTGGAAQMFICKPVAAAAHTNPYFAYALYYDGAGPILGVIKMSIDTTGTATFADGTNSCVGPAGIFKHSEWQHIAATYDGANMRLYQNGTLVTTTIHVGSLFERATPVRLGSNGANQETLLGRLADVRIYNRALSDGEIYVLSRHGDFPVIASDRRHSVKAIASVATFRPWLMYS